MQQSSQRGGECHDKGSCEGYLKKKAYGANDEVDEDNLYYFDELFINYGREDSN